MSPTTSASPPIGCIRRIRGRPTDPYPLIFVDERGLPLVALTEWYRWCGERTALNTRDTYASCLLRWHAYLAQEGVAWDAPTRQLQQVLVAYHKVVLGCQVEPVPPLGQIKIKSTAATPLRDSTLGVMRAAIRHFYALLIDEGLYHDLNPLASALLTRLEMVRRVAVLNGGAPDHAGIRASTYRRRTPAFVRQPSAQWRVNWRQATLDVAAGIHEDMRAMLAQPSIRHRDRAIILLLVHTGARVSEVIRMSVGGYRCAGVAGQALVRTKGSRGREVKTIHFAQAASVQRALTCYLAQERPRWDRTERSLQEVADTEPFFLSMRGTAYTEEAFYQHWYRLYRATTHPGRRAFSPHDLRHLMVTECLRLAREQCAGDGDAYQRAKKGLEVLMDWRSPRTVEVYDHSLDPELALGLVVARTRRWDEQTPAPQRVSSLTPDGRTAVPDRPTPVSDRSTPAVEAPSGGRRLAARMREHYGERTGGPHP